MNDFVPEPPPTWTPEVQSAYDRFIAYGGTPELWQRANPELLPLPTAQPPKPRPADGLDEAYARVAVNTVGRVLAKMQRSQRGRQGR